jgi:hypothetical protein
MGHYERDLLGHRRLSDVQKFRRRHRALLGNGQGVLELTKADRLPRCAR